ncbi:MAG TPA: ATP-binding cassette domain-containing protein [Chromatiales bacterium]|nr:ATP-binding cassette domain-containing protein [Thiotrichales bacterium]HIP69186.1 ATP-binding cassette domain-containing protein [Chromatiales bacterium]
MALIRLQNIHLSYGLPALFESVDFSIEKGERVALIGRNGTGKSTLMKMINGEVKPDDGEIVAQKELKVARLEQEVPEGLEGSVYDVVASGLGELGELITAWHHVIQRLDDEAAMNEMTRLQSAIEKAEGWSFEQRISTTISRLDLPSEASISSLSGGLKRRVLLARALVSEPDILLLDEPTNHLDIEAIEWLESFLVGAGITLIFITHDRSFLRKLATRIAEIDRGRITSWPGDFDDYLQGKQAALESEEKTQAVFDKKLAQEEIWIRQGIKARRTRNEGRVRALKKMRAERSARREKTGKANIQLNKSELSGKIVIEAENVSYQYDTTPIIRGFSTTILRGDKVGVIGPNGVGKSTLLNLLLGNLKPDTGKLKLGTNIEVAYFDQLRASLDMTKTAQENVAGGGDKVIVNGKEKHIISYLQDFLFSPDRARAPITRLSGGEKNRLLLARLFAKPFNFLVMDEPTNDLDVETLELLEDLLINYTGTLLLVSHDREFIDNVVTSTLVFEGDGIVSEYVGGYSDWQRQKQPSQQVENPGKKKESVKTAASSTKKLSYKDQRELAEMPGKIETLEQQQETFHALMAAPDFYKRPENEISQAKNDLEKIETELEEIFLRWEELEGSA